LKETKFHIYLRLKLKKNPLSDIKMKKQLVILFIFLSASFYANAQVNSQAIGIRGGGNGVISGGEISYQYGLSDVNRLELDFGFGVSNTQSRLFAVGIYHWDWNITD
jgi:hypothetical protein